MKKIFEPIVGYFRSVISEVKKISFPTQKQIITDSTVVLGVIIVSIVLIGLFDGTVSQLIKDLVLKG
ncbi:preprotein translocase subunit SecE [Candidatus Berkelbacteria bacterium CG_4_10_14_0_8_um_filter_35_9_33_8]|uniref:Protein translocase subunit SecE n=1 Tax=Candidatus Berkelbacteria bacterium CG_4_10_14_0_2_um_filter_35_9_33_12 TaxID=1974499 RepID=A0A2M7W485_9BACT|nr:MAG: preprotein translocase subunit SecE [Candidatus Berkelbacteria bacterium CG23_combo_of_CG06-09_8_20_14_all_33_15]PIS08150.1 MAG: preprotein translocase subunit SecE [Candidatus Berkelbacteria bacterium CG10_big_fil_rev_8_21_14_0_10_33_10]PIZ28358.1 MAG: preprotein translocase subunit SecE [Candidatus Berkelbacteria bacterium CG_4_10_14_0_8_um_filter_35_9_33_8]PJA20479.1 MAG: preprotein translocase subunit SecE [Candidatus Berkelbacteria bacterium CG_4_10_14_0_2_um_filter_35_9_33_12]